MPDERKEFEELTIKFGRRLIENNRINRPRKRKRTRSGLYNDENGRNAWERVIHL
jgi:hypothetical protein